MPAKSGSWSDAVETSALLVSVLFLIELLDYFLRGALNPFGIVPRTAPGLIGVLFAPLLHLNGAHLMANAIPLFILLVLLFWDRKYHPERTMAIIWVFSGLGTWLIGRGNACHIGASSLIYGLVVYFIVAAFRMRSWRAAIVAILVFIFYGGIFYGMVPQKEMVSWEGHLSGAISGWIAARWNHR